MQEILQRRQYKIHGIELISFSIQPQSPGEQSKEVFKFNIQQEQRTNAEKKIIIIFTSINIRNFEDRDTLASLRVACGFEFNAFDDVFKKEKDESYLIPHELNIIINRISIATTRGILFNQLRGTYLQNSILPILYFE